MSKIAGILTAVVAVVILLAFFYPAYGDRTSEFGREDVFIKGQLVTHRYDDLPQGQPLGEPFTIKIRIQYKVDRVEMELDSLKNADFWPFEKTGKESIRTRELIRTYVNREDVEVSEEISEIIYSVELIAIEAIPGEFYRIKNVPLEFWTLKKDSGERTQLTTRNLAQMEVMIIGIGKRSPDNIKYINMRPPKGEIVESNFVSTILYLVAGVFSAIVALILFLRWRKPEGKEEDLKKETRTIKLRLLEIQNKGWPNKIPLDDRMYELERIAITLAQDFEYIDSVEEFWTHELQSYDRTEKWARMMSLFEMSYSKEDTSQGNVDEALNLVLDIFFNGKKASLSKLTFSRSD